MNRIHQQIAVLLIVLGASVLSGCQETPAAAPPPAGSTSQSAAAAPEGGSSDSYCKLVTSGGDAISGYDDAATLSDDQKAKITSQLKAMVDAAPSDLKPTMETIARVYGRLMSGETTKDNTDQMTELGTAIAKYTEWMTKHCITG
ncbi:hypothetical protein ACI2LF_28050 [Kribbella sp. NPDC020789]